MWRSTISVGSVIIGSAWAAAFGAVVLGWMLDQPYLAHMGVLFAALGATLVLAGEHNRTRRHVYAVNLAMRTDDTIEPPRAQPVSRIRTQRD